MASFTKIIPYLLAGGIAMGLFSSFLIKQANKYTMDGPGMENTDYKPEQSLVLTDVNLEQLKGRWSEDRYRYAMEFDGTTLILRDKSVVLKSKISSHNRTYYLDDYKLSYDGENYYGQIQSFQFSKEKIKITIFYRTPENTQEIELHPVDNLYGWKKDDELLKKLDGSYYCDVTGYTITIRDGFLSTTDEKESGKKYPIFAGTQHSDKELWIVNSDCYKEIMKIIPETADTYSIAEVITATDDGGSWEYIYKKTK